MISLDPVLVVELRLTGSSFLTGVWLAFIYMIPVETLELFLSAHSFLIQLVDLGYWGYATAFCWKLWLRENYGEIRWYFLGSAVTGAYVFYQVFGRHYQKGLKFTAKSVKIWIKSRKWKQGE